MVTLQRSTVQPYLNPILSKCLLVGFLSIAGIFLGIIPELSPQSSRLTFSNSAYAQTVSDDEVNRYAQAAYAIELKRQATAAVVKKFSGGNVPGFACNQLDSFSGQVRNTIEEFCRFSRDTIGKNGFTVSRFNQIATSQDTDLKRRIDAALQRMQDSP